MRKLSANSDFLTGLLFVVFGLVVAWLSRPYPLGSLARMGPGLFPTVLAALLVVIGVLVLANAARAHDDGSAPFGKADPRAIVFIPLAVVAFGLTIDRMGLIVAAVLVTFIGGLAFRGVRLLRLGIFSVGLAAAMALLFVHLLGLQIRLWP